MMPKQPPRLPRPQPPIGQIACSGVSLNTYIGYHPRICDVEIMEEHTPELDKEDVYYDDKVDYDRGLGYI